MNLIEHSLEAVYASLDCIIQPHQLIGVTLYSVPIPYQMVLLAYKQVLAASYGVLRAFDSVFIAEQCILVSDQLIVISLEEVPSAPNQVISSVDSVSAGRELRISEQILDGGESSEIDVGVMGGCDVPIGEIDGFC